MTSNLELDRQNASTLREWMVRYPDDPEIQRILQEATHKLEPTEHLDETNLLHWALQSLLHR